VLDARVGGDKPLGQRGTFLAVVLPLLFLDPDASLAGLLHGFFSLGVVADPLARDLAGDTGGLPLPVRGGTPGHSGRFARLHGQRLVERLLGGHGPRGREDVRLAPPGLPVGGSGLPLLDGASAPSTAEQPGWRERLSRGGSRSRARGSARTVRAAIFPPGRG